ALFEPLAEASPELITEREAAKIKLKTGVRLTAVRRNNLLSYVNRCATAEVGQRSGADFALVCYCVERGYDKEEIWQQVADVGKFGQRGRPYFDLTWGKAEKKTRLRYYERARPRAAHPHSAGPAAPGNPPPALSPAGLPPSGGDGEAKDLE